MDLVDEGDDLPCRVGDLLENSLQPLLELTAILRAREHGADVEADQALVLQPLGNIAIGDSASETFNDGGLADAGFTDQHWVVLGAP